MNGEPSLPARFARPDNKVVRATRNCTVGPADGRAREGYLRNPVNRVNPVQKISPAFPFR